MDLRRAIDARADRCSLFGEVDELDYTEAGRRAIGEAAFQALRPVLPLE